MSNLQLRCPQLRCSQLVRPFRSQLSLLQDPSNDVYRKAVEMTKKAPELHKELQRQLAAQGEVRINPSFEQPCYPPLLC